MRNSLKSHLKSIKLSKILLISILSILLILVFLKIVFPLLGQLTFSKTGIQVSSYYSVFAITLFCIVPYLIGILYAKVIRVERSDQSSYLSAEPTSLNSFLLIRMIFAAFVCFVFELLAILIVKPVPTEGWLRNLFAACLLSIQAPFVCMMICFLMKKKVKRFFVFVLCSIFLITVPFGLLVHHPWNYFVFFSPLYWVSWAWIVRSPLESLLYGTISVIITSISLIVFLRSLLKKNSV